MGIGLPNVTDDLLFCPFLKSNQELTLGPLRGWRKRRANSIAVCSAYHSFRVYWEHEGDELAPGLEQARPCVRPVLALLRLQSAQEPMADQERTWRHVPVICPRARDTTGQRCFMKWSAIGMWAGTYMPWEHWLRHLLLRGSARTLKDALHNGCDGLLLSSSGCICQDNSDGRRMFRMQRMS